MNIKSKPMGTYQTNCYILDFGNFQIIIDSGVDSFKWIEKNVIKPKAILLTHGHFDHFWDSYKIAEKYKIDIFVNKNDKPLLEESLLSIEQPTFKPHLIKFLENNVILNVNGIECKFHHLAGHSAGSSLIEIENNYFSGDILFKGGIGRYDLPLSNKNQMQNSLKKLLTNFNHNYPVYCGHGLNTTIKEEVESIKNWI